MNKMSPSGIAVNNRSYPFPKVTAVAICLDGCEPAYIDAAIAAGVMPTIFKTYFEAGCRIAIVTAKDKLRALLGHGLKFDEGRAICFSTEKSDTTTIQEHGIDNASKTLGIPVPSVYSAELSEYVFDAGVKLMKSFKPDIMYLTTTDYVQHKAAPGTKDANAFYAMFDRYLGELDALGAAIIITGDHGMKPKYKADGTPDVLYMQDLLDTKFGEGATRVILPITDPYVVHHGALGSFATAYLTSGIARADVIAYLADMDGIELVLDREAAAKRFDLPPERIGDIVIISTENRVLGTSKDRHDLTALDVPLRSHGGLSEQKVPFILNRAVPDLPSAPVLRNFDAFYYVTRAAAVQAAE